MTDGLDARVLNIVKQLHTIRSFPSDHDELHFDHLLLNVVTDVCQMVNFTGKTPYALDMSCSIYEPLSLIFYSSNPHVANTEVTYENIFLFLGDVDSSTDSVFRAILQILSQARKLDRRPAKIRPQYAEIVSLFAALVESLWLLYASSQDAIINYIQQCLVYEYKYFCRLDQKLPSSELEGRLTQDLLKALDGLSDPTDYTPENRILHNHDVDGDDDSLFSYGPSQPDLGSEPSSPTAQILDFKCNNTILSKLYRNFLQLSLLKKDKLFWSHTRSYSQLMVEFFKKKAHIDIFELNSYAFKEERLQILYDFFLGSETHSGIVPSQYVERATRLFDNLILTSDDVPQNHLEESSNISSDALIPEANTLLRRGFQKGELLHVHSNLETVFSILNEYDLQFDHLFPGYFAHLIHLVYEELPDLASAEDFELIEEVVWLVGRIIDFEANDEASQTESIKDIVEKLYRLQAFFSPDNEQTTLLMRLAAKEFSNNFELQKSIIRDWNSRALKATHLDLILTSSNISLYRHKPLTDTLNRWFDKSKRMEALYRLAETYSNRKLLVKFFSSHWIGKIVSIGLAEQEAYSKVYRRMMDKWKSSLEEKKALVTKLDTFYEQQGLRKYLSVLLHKYIETQDLSDRGDQLRLQFEANNATSMKNEVFRKWYGKLGLVEIPSRDGGSAKSQLISKLVELSKREKLFLTSRHFNIWKRQWTLSNIHKDLQESQGLLLKAKVLSAWRNTQTLEMLHDEFLKKRGITTRNIIFAYWMTKKVQSGKAKKFERLLSIRTHFHIWALNNRFKTSSFIKGDTAACFKKWRLKAAYSALSVKKPDQRAALIGLWNSRFENVKDNEAAADELYMQSLSKKTLDVWRDRLILVAEQESHVENIILRKYFDLLRSRKLCLDELSGRIMQKGYLFNEKVVVSTALRRWKQKYLEQFETYSNEKATTFRDIVSKKGVLRVFIRNWQHKTHEANIRERVLNQRANALVSGNPTTRPFLSSWVARMTKVTADEETADVFLVSIQMKRFLLAWYEKYITKSSYLSELAEDFLDRAEYGMLIDYLRKWSLRYVKIIKRNEQTCDMFSRRWEMARSKSIFELWLYKSRVKETEKNETQESEDPDISMISTTSPLAKKRAGFQERRSYLYTPVKKQVASLPFTPSSRTQRVSPTRLQETNQRMKNDKMDALISRYRTARPESYKFRSPNHQRITNTSQTRLSPPRPPTSYRLLATKPPAPNFDPLELPEAASSPVLFGSTESPPNSPSRYIEPSTSILDTAKKLKRLRPLVVLSSRDENQGSTPAARLRERLGLASESNVFSN